jgi:hypothetical protein
MKWVVIGVPGFIGPCSSKNRLAASYLVTGVDDFIAHLRRRSRGTTWLNRSSGTDATLPATRPVTTMK